VTPTVRMCWFSLKWKYALSVSERGPLGRDFLLQGRVFSFGLLEDRDVGVSVFPESEKIAVGGAGLGDIAPHGIAPSDLKAHQRSLHAVVHYTSVVQQFLKFDGRGCTVVSQKVGLATNVGR